MCAGRPRLGYEERVEKDRGEAEGYIERWLAKPRARYIENFL
jgi:hypothetical protein